MLDRLLKSSTNFRIGEKPNMALALRTGAYFYGNSSVGRALVSKTRCREFDELTHTAMVVLSASLIIAIVVFIMDSVFRFVMSTVYPS